jgi:transposase InsO family protein
MKKSSVSHSEAVARFRRGIIGDLLCRDLEPGGLQDELKVRAERRYRPPGSEVTRTYHWKTLQSWYYAAKEGPRALEPASRSRGYGLALGDEQRQLLLQIRREHRSASAELILQEAIRNGIVAVGSVSVSTVRRLFAQADISRTSRTRANRRRTRSRWEASRPGLLWHSDVCHLWLRGPDGRPRKAYIHGILDDASRFVPILEARKAERETDMLSIFCAALLQVPACEILYLDNGSCYRGDDLAHFASALGIRLVHAKPHDPEARGKMERFWRTLRQRCTDFLPATATLQDVNAALLAFLDADYHRRPHASLMGRTPQRVFQDGIRALPAPRTPAELARALEVETTRVVKKDGTVQIGSRTWEVAGRYLAGKTLALWLDPFTGAPLRASYQDHPVSIGPCDKVANSRRPRIASEDEPDECTVPFDPIAALLAKARKEADHG